MWSKTSQVAAQNVITLAGAGYVKPQMQSVGDGFDGQTFTSKQRQKRCLANFLKIERISLRIIVEYRASANSFQKVYLSFARVPCCLRQLSDFHAFTGSPF